MTTGMVAGYILSFLLGLVAGSFINVVIYRYNSGTMWGKRSKCLHCNQVLAAKDLVPLVSFFTLKGRCRYCQSRLSLQYPLVELLTAVIFTAIFYRLGFNIPEVIFYWLVAGVLLVIAGYDFKHKIIPQGLIYTLMILGLLSPVVTNLDEWLLIAVIVGLAHNLFSGLVFYYFFWGLWKISHGRWIGLGDAKLVLGIGFLLGLARGLTAIILGFWIGAIIALLLLYLSRQKQFTLPGYLAKLKLNWQSELAFAPFLVAGTLVVIISNLNVIPL